mgnify:CR=1 FL=1
MGGGVNPPVVTLVEPEDPDIGDPVGAERMFTAECDQPATMRVYLDSDRSGACESLVAGEASNVVRFEREGFAWIDAATRDGMVTYFAHR